MVVALRGGEEKTILAGVELLEFELSQDRKLLRLTLKTTGMGRMDTTLACPRISEAGR